MGELHRMLVKQRQSIFLSFFLFLFFFLSLLRRLVQRLDSYDPMTFYNRIQIRVPSNTKCKFHVYSCAVNIIPCHTWTKSKSKSTPLYLEYPTLHWQKKCSKNVGTLHIYSCTWEEIILKFKSKSVFSKLLTVVMVLIKVTKAWCSFLRGHWGPGGHPALCIHSKISTWLHRSNSHKHGSRNVDSLGRKQSPKGPNIHTVSVRSTCLQDIRLLWFSEFITGRLRHCTRHPSGSRSRPPRLQYGGPCVWMQLLTQHRRQKEFLTFALEGA